MRIQLENEALKAEIETLGGELMSLQDKESGREYLWNGDSSFWGRRSPVLFPFVGSVRDKEYRAKDKVYPMSQHGFARDMEFVLCEETTKEETWLCLRANQETLAKYPYDFRLSLGYRLEGRSLRVLWKVENPAAEPMYFSIGGHPGFFCPHLPGAKQTDYQIRFDTPDQVTASLIGSKGLATDEKKVYPLKNGLLDITADLFAKDALVIEGHQAHQVSFLQAGAEPYLTVSFDAPLFGIWAPFKKDVPFICIEPWYGRCDHEDFTGTLSQREWGNTLEAGGVWEAAYVIGV